MQVEEAKGKIEIRDLREGMLHVTIEARVVGLIELATVKGAGKVPRRG